MFRGAASFAGDLSSWDVSAVTDMRSMFQDASALQGLDLSGWDVSTVTDMHRMFFGAWGFRGYGLSWWDTRSVTDMSEMFAVDFDWRNGWGPITSKFNADLSGWDVSSVTNMRGMFMRAKSFNADLSGWNVSSVTDMSFMFFKAVAFASSVSNWDVGSVVNMEAMFQLADAFNGDIREWNMTLLQNDIGMLACSLGLFRCGGLGPCRTETATVLNSDSRELSIAWAHGISAVMNMVRIDAFATLDELLLSNGALIDRGWGERCFCTATHQCFRSNAWQQTCQPGTVGCAPCRLGWFFPPLEHTCRPCPAGLIGSDGLACAQCPPHSTSFAVGSTSASTCTCDAGFTGPDGGPCVACEPGKFKVDAGSHECSTCPAGTVNERPWETSAICDPPKVAHGGVCLLLHETAASYDQARSQCTDAGGDIATVMSAKDTDVLLSIVGAGDRVWIGLTDGVTEGTWTLPNGTLASYFNWAPHEPNNAGSGEDCTELVASPNGQWNDVDCDASRAFVCALPSKEWCVRTCPVGRYELNISSCGAEDIAHGETCLRLHQTAVSYDQARSQCTDAGGDIATVMSAKDTDVLLSIVGAVGFVWIGLTDGVTEGTWTLPNGTLASYFNWAPHEPNNAGSGEDCTELVSQNGQWNDVDCDASRAFVCALSPRLNHTCVAACPAGLIALDVLACAQCPPHSTSSAVGSTSASTCTCDAGFTGPDGGPCVACAPGKFKVDAGSHECSTCPAGTVNERPWETSATLHCDPPTVAHGGVCLLLHETAASYDQARSQCTDAGGDIATVMSAKDTDVLLSIVGAVGFVWIGLTDGVTEGTWTLPNGTLASYFNWAPHEPNNAGSGEDCTELSSQNGQWNDVDCDASRAFVCALSPNRTCVDVV